MLERITLPFLFFLLPLSLLTPCVDAFWIFDHVPLVQDRIDPLAFPGIVSDHVHTIIGSSNFRPTLDTATMTAGNCSTAPVQADMSNYWAPQLYHRDITNNTYTLIPLISVKTYYLQRDGPTNKTIETFPPGLRMIAGSQNRTEYNASSVVDQAVSFVCLDPASDGGPKPLMPNQNCQFGLRAQVNFPSCWDGNNTDSEDHMSHMAYPIGAPDYGDCPRSHPHKTVLLFTEWVFDVGKFNFVSGEKNWAFANGDDTGLTFHADFINGWQEDVLADAVASCTSDLFGNVEGCPAFVPHIDRPRAEQCTGTAYVQEDIRGPLAALPGCNPSPAQIPAPSCPGMTTPALLGYPSATGTSSTPTPTSAESASATITTTSASATISATATADPVSSLIASMSSALASLSSVSSAMSSAMASCQATPAPTASAGSNPYKRRGLHHHPRRGGH